MIANNLDLCTAFRNGRDKCEISLSFANQSLFDVSRGMRGVDNPKNTNYRMMRCQSERFGNGSLL